MANESIFAGKKILVTGGTGSFGHYIVKELAYKNPEEIRIFSRDEKKQDDMRYEFREMNNLRFILGDVRNKDSLKVAAKNVDIVFHAAALKQVPGCEYNVYEAVLTNIVGGKNLVDVAIEEDVEKVIAVSTDKAVKPVNSMGMTKALQEKLMIWGNLNRNGSKTVFASVRYGNVVGSRGSVVPLLKKQIESGEPLTITDPDMTRFILTLNQAIKLVFKAAEEAVGGEVFVMKVPSIKIGDLAETMISHIPEHLKPQIRIIGIRPGEKVNEVLVSEEESYRTVDMGEYFCILPAMEIKAVKDKYDNWKRVTFSEYTSGNTDLYTNEQMRQLLEAEDWMPGIPRHIKLTRHPEETIEYPVSDRIGIAEEAVLL
ncbi:MAG: NAD-dependent epimerase/dehydratase family protein [candidate division Zixibacteria bacterium]|nr:NAD-dependent epimerase/dehydratase family protein [candidate division Zixibacteria bacterium]